MVGHSVGDRFELTALIAAGGAGDVYAAVDREGGRTVAVKLFGPSWARDEDAHVRLADDLERVAALALPEVVPYLVVGRLSDGRPYVVTQLAFGSSLETVLARGARLDAAEVVALLTGIGAALDTAHASGVILRTLSPKKLLLTWEPRQEPLVIVGVGTGALLAIGASARAPTVDIGTYNSLAYCAPEATESSAGPAADVYTVAAIAYQLMAGALPAGGMHTGDDPLKQLAAKRHAQAGAMREASRTPFADAIEEVLGHALSAEPGERYQTVGDFLADLSRAAQERAIRGPSRGRLRETGMFEPGRTRDVAASLLALIERDRGHPSDADTRPHRIPD